MTLLLLQRYMVQVVCNFYCSHLSFLFLHSEEETHLQVTKISFSVTNVQSYLGGTCYYSKTDGTNACRRCRRWLRRNSRTERNRQTSGKRSFKTHRTRCLRRSCTRKKLEGKKNGLPGNNEHNCSHQWNLYFLFDILKKRFDRSLQYNRVLKIQRHK